MRTSPSPICDVVTIVVFHVGDVWRGYMRVVASVAEASVLHHSGVMDSELQV